MIRALRMTWEFFHNVWAERRWEHLHVAVTLTRITKVANESERIEAEWRMAQAERDGRS